MFTSSGMSRPYFIQSSGVISTPAWRAIATRCGCALVEPPIAAMAAIALRNDWRVRIFEGRRSSYAISTMRRPVS